MHIGLYFGSFNPIHVGHLIIANHMAQNTKLDQVWFVVTPLNPHKRKADLVHHFDRIDMVDLAIDGNPLLKSSDVEFRLTMPNYTINTMKYLVRQYAQHTFSLIMGQDNLATFHKWKDHEMLLANHRIYCYPRPGASTPEWATIQQVEVVDAPIIEISSSYIRQMLKQNKSVKYLIPEAVENYIRLKKLFV